MILAFIALVTISAAPAAAGRETHSVYVGWLLGTTRLAAVDPPGLFTKGEGE
jgi:hypothetical protein